MVRTGRDQAKAARATCEERNEKGQVPSPPKERCPGAICTRRFPVRSGWRILSPPVGWSGSAAVPGGWTLKELGTKALPLHYIYKRAEYGETGILPRAK